MTSLASGWALASRWRWARLSWPHRAHDAAIAAGPRPPPRPHRSVRLVARRRHDRVEVDETTGRVAVEVVELGLGEDEDAVEPPETPTTMEATA